MNGNRLQRTAPKTLGLLGLLLSLAAVNANAQGKAVDLTKQSPAEIFGEKCGMCHRGNGMGSTLLGRRYQGDQAQLENRTDLQAAFIATVVRGGLGVMYPISRGEVSDEQLAKITQHLVKQGGKK